MKQAMLDVLAFMKIGQPDYVAGALRRPNLREPESQFLSPCGSRIDDMAAEMVAFAKQLGESDDGKLPSVLGARLMLEELGETLQAMANGDVVESADGLAGLAYVVCWTAVAHGIPLGEVFAEVHRSNMAKFPACSTCGGSGRRPLIQTLIQGSDLRLLASIEELEPCETCKGAGRVVVRDAGGKTQKPPGWTPPDIAGVLECNSEPVVDSVEVCKSVTKLEGSGSCSACVGTGFGPFYPLDSPQWSEVASALVPTYPGADYGVQRSIRQLVKLVAFYALLPPCAFDNLGVVYDHPTEGLCHPDPASLAYESLNATEFAAASFSEVRAVLSGVELFFSTKEEKREPCVECAGGGRTLDWVGLLQLPKERRLAAIERIRSESLAQLAGPSETPVLPTDLGQLLQANTVKTPEGFGLNPPPTAFATIYSDDPNWLHLGPVPGNVRINLATGEVMLPEGADSTQAAKAFWDAVAALGNSMYPRKTETPSTRWPPSWQELANMPKAERLKIIERVRQAARSNLLQPAEVESEPTAPPGPRPSVYSPNGWRLFTDGGGGDWTLVNSSPPPHGRGLHEVVQPLPHPPGRPRRGRQLRGSGRRAGHTLQRPCPEPEQGRATRQDSRVGPFRARAGVRHRAVDDGAPRVRPGDGLEDDARPPTRHRIVTVGKTCEVWVEVTSGTVTQLRRAVEDLRTKDAHFPLLHEQCLTRRDAPIFVIGTWYKYHEPNPRGFVARALGRAGLSGHLAVTEAEAQPGDLMPRVTEPRRITSFQPPTRMR